MRHDGPGEHDALRQLGNAAAVPTSACRTPSTAAPRDLAALPEPFQQAYTLAQEADAAGDTETVEEIADTLRVSPSGHLMWPEGMQMLFDPEPFAVRVRTASGTPRATPKTLPQRSGAGVVARATTPAPALLDLEGN